MSERINYTNATRCPVVLCYVKYTDDGGPQGEFKLVDRGGPRELFLFMRRGYRVAAMQGLWGVVAGFMDYPDWTATDHAADEYCDETGNNPDAIIRVAEGPVYDFEADNGKTYERHLFLLEVNTARVTLSWENTGAIWLPAGEIAEYKTCPGIVEDFEKVRKL